MTNFFLRQNKAGIINYFILLLLIFSFSCASTKSLGEGEELVEYKDLDYKVLNKKELTEAELRKDCDMLKYLLYNSYAGIDEAIKNGFDLDAAIEEIYNKTLTKKSLGKYPSDEFSKAIYEVFSKKLNNDDLHLSLAGHSIKESYSIYYTNIYLEKKGEKYFVKEIRPPKSDEDGKNKSVKFDENPDVRVGMEYTGPEKNLYSFLLPGGLEYRYGVFINKKVRTAQISLENTNYVVPISNENPIRQKNAWTGIKTTKETLYMSLGDCNQVNGIGDKADLRSLAWDKYLAELSENARGKKNIIFDLRSNTGGRYEYPAKMLAATYFYNHKEKDEIKDLQNLFSNTITQDMTFLVSPVTMTHEKKYYTDYGKNLFEQMDQDRQDFFENYWKKIKRRPIRKHIPLKEYTTKIDTFPQPDFQGDVYILINKNTASAAEFGSGMAYLLQDKGIKVHLIGENSMGAFKYGGMQTNYLPNSGLNIYAGVYFGESPNMKQNQNWLGEGYGFKPDYYATKENLLSTLILLTKDIELADSLKGLEKEQL
ncbi:MAG: hypothetical protein K5829_02490 [Treponema sp.]|nr:hypothetical protein [Treponema sp.]